MLQAVEALGMHSKREIEIQPGAFRPRRFGNAAQLPPQRPLGVAVVKAGIAAAAAVMAGAAGLLLDPRAESRVTPQRRIVFERLPVLPQPLPGQRPGEQLERFSPDGRHRFEIDVPRRTSAVNRAANLRGFEIGPRRGA